MQVQIKFITTAITASHGTLVTGDLLRCSREEAAHYVNDCKAAEYVVEPVAPVEAPAEPEVKSKRKKD